MENSGKSNETETEQMEESGRVDDGQGDAPVEAQAADGETKPVKAAKDGEAKDSGSMEALMDMYEESFKRFAEGEVVTGRIISVDKDHVLVDIGYKSEGQIRIQEFRRSLHTVLQFFS